MIISSARHRMRHACRGLLALLALCMVAACGSLSQRPANEGFAPVASMGAAPEPVDERLRAGDVLDVVVLGQPELTRTVRVAASGELSLPLIGALPAAGRTVVEVEGAIADALRARYLQDPQVSVFLKEAVGRKVTVSGAVRTPGLYPIDPETTLLQAIALAQGLDPLADERAVVVLRPSTEGRVAAVFDLKAIQRGQHADPALRFGDIVVVEQSGSKTALRRFIETVPAIGVFGLFR